MAYRQAWKESIWAFALAGLLVLPGGFASAQGRAATAADVAAYVGPDRTEKLIAGA